MKYKKYLIIASREDIAGKNITTQISQFRKNPILAGLQKTGVNFDIYISDESILYTENLDLGKISKYDFIIFASKHQSEKKEKTLSIHSPGNWNNASYGGSPEKVCKSSALFQKFLFEKFKENIDLYKVKNYKLTLEVTHHGPLIDKPCVFIEIGSTENEWKDKRAGFVVAKTISEAIQEFKESPYREVAIAIGGPHYCPNFNKIQLNSNIAISHIISSYSFPLKEKMIKEALEKTEEEVDFAILDWKGLGNTEEKQKILNLLDRLYISYKKTSEIKK